MQAIDANVARATCRAVNLLSSIRNCDSWLQAEVRRAYVRSEARRTIFRRAVLRAKRYRHLAVARFALAIRFGAKRHRSVLFALVHANGREFHVRTKCASGASSGRRAINPPHRLARAIATLVAFSRDGLRISRRRVVSVIKMDLELVLSPERKCRDSGTVTGFSVVTR